MEQPFAGLRFVQNCDLMNIRLSLRNQLVSNKIVNYQENNKNDENIKNTYFVFSKLGW